MKISAYCRWERRRPFTQNDKELDTFLRQTFERFVQLRCDILQASAERSARDEQPTQTPVHHGPFAAPPSEPPSPIPIIMPDDIAAFCRLAGRGYRVSPANMVKVHDPDEYQNELQLMSGAAAYFKIAWKRIVDIVPMCIENEFLVTFAVELREKLVENLGLIGDAGMEKCKEYAVEEPSLKEMKDSLMKMKDTLDMATKIMAEI